MAGILINDDELSALNGLPYIQQLLYLRGIKPYMDYRSGIVGLARGISYQSLGEALYIEPHSGIKSGSPSKDQIRRAINGLEKAGLLHIQSLDWKLVFQCVLATSDISNQNKPAIKPQGNPTSKTLSENSVYTRDAEVFETEPTTIKATQPAIPPNNNYYFIFLYEKFEEFWNRYPLKRSKQKAWKEFQALQPTETLMNCMLSALDKQAEAHTHQVAHGQWVPDWKFPANWLAQHCWEDEIIIDTTKENINANHQKDNTAKRSIDPFWDSCKDGAEYELSNSNASSDSSENNIINLCGYRKT
jgi:hypothetical protein